jgi:hypothetical protein
MSERFKRSVTSQLEQYYDVIGTRLDRTEYLSALHLVVLDLRLPDGASLIERFLAAMADLPSAERDMLLGWHDPVESFFELRSTREADASMTLNNLLDDLDYQVYSGGNVSVIRALPRKGFIHTRLVRFAPDAWTAFGPLDCVDRHHSAEIAAVAVETAYDHPERVFRNPAMAERGWERLREDRDRFIEYSGSDELVLPVDQAASVPRAYFHENSWQLPEHLRHAETVGIIYDPVAGLTMTGDYRKADLLFENPKLSTDSEYANLLLGYIGDDQVSPVPLARLAQAHPDTVDAVYRTVLRSRDFRWATDGESLLRERKKHFYEQQQYPPVYAAIGDRLRQLTGRHA